MELVYSLLAACCFAAGGVFMKSSSGATRPAATFSFLALFAVGAVLQALAMRRADMGAVYVAVLGLEAILALALGIIFLQERLSWQRAAAVLLVLAGVCLLRRF